ncbi:MAG TPA: hypothetical protein VFQ12_08670 [Thermoleophilaceae bacterium]|nr:hypothetical protein [Thermoleophilaceae bacterium]
MKAAIASALAMQGASTVAHDLVIQENARAADRTGAQPETR